MKNSAIFVSILIIIVLVVGAVALFSGGKDKAGTEKGSSELVNVFEKNSILKSEDSGLNFLSGLKIESSLKKLGTVDILGIAFHPNSSGTMILGSLEDGLYRKDNNSENWKPIPFPPNTIYSFLLDKKSPDNKIFVSSVSDEFGKIFRTEDSGANWRAVYTEPGTGTIITSLSQDPRNKDIIFAGTSGGTVVKSIDGGNSWKNIGNNIDGTIKDISFDATKPAIAYLLAFGNKMYYSVNNGEVWLDWEETKNKEMEALTQKISDLYGAGSTALAEKAQKDLENLQKKSFEERMPSGIIVILPDPLKSGVLYAGTGQGLFRSMDYGKYWKEINIIESAKTYPIRSIAINPKNSNEIVFVSGKSFYKSTNFGSTWAVTSLEGDRNASFVTYNPFDTKQIYIGLSKDIGF